MREGHVTRNVATLVVHLTRGANRLVTVRRRRHDPKTQVAALASRSNSSSSGVGNPIQLAALLSSRRSTRSSVPIIMASAFRRRSWSSTTKTDMSTHGMLRVTLPGTS